MVAVPAAALYSLPGACKLEVLHAWNCLRWALPPLAAATNHAAANSPRSVSRLPAFDGSFPFGLMPTLYRLRSAHDSLCSDCRFRSSAIWPYGLRAGCRVGAMSLVWPRGLISATGRRGQTLGADPTALIFRAWPAPGEIPGSTDRGKAGDGLSVPRSGGPGGEAINGLKRDVSDGPRPVATVSGYAEGVWRRTGTPCAAR